MFFERNQLNPTVPRSLQGHQRQGAAVRIRGQGKPDNPGFERT